MKKATFIDKNTGEIKTLSTTQPSWGFETTPCPISDTDEIVEIIANDKAKTVIYGAATLVGLGLLTGMFVHYCLQGVKDSSDWIDAERASHPSAVHGEY